MLSDSRLLLEITTHHLKFGVVTVPPFGQQVVPFPTEFFVLWQLEALICPFLHQCSLSLFLP